MYTDKEESLMLNFIKRFKNVWKGTPYFTTFIKRPTYGMGNKILRSQFENYEVRMHWSCGAAFGRKTENNTEISKMTIAIMTITITLGVNMITRQITPFPHLINPVNIDILILQKIC